MTSRELLYQARASFAKRLCQPLEDIGIIGDGHWKVGDWVTIVVEVFDAEELFYLVGSADA